MVVRKKISLVLHGPNPNLLGRREVGIYGSMTLEDINNLLHKEAESALGRWNAINPTANARCWTIFTAHLKSMMEYINPGAIHITALHCATGWQGLTCLRWKCNLPIFMPGKSFADRLVIAPVVQGQISGFGPQSYLLALQALCNISISR